MKCEICRENASRYKCPKCGVHYCSLACYKNEEKHVHEEQAVTATEQPSATPAPLADAPKLASPHLDRLFQSSDRLRELLRHNTVKYHLHRVYRILTVGNGITGTDDVQMSTEMKEQLAVDYLNTLRYGGIHENEAIEEFCQIFLELLEQQRDA
ncbi:AaceriAFR384Wp [[Ashbya] aceris (nom. inval.)]|nr:AaceriAFR384Wp [[Ashbya] aceris (nom. inval.)]